MDKSTCQTYNLKNNFLGYRGIPTARTKLLLDEIAEKHGVFILVVPQSTHIFILTDVMRFFILYKRSECGVFLLRFVQIISYGIGNVRVMRFATIAQFNGVSCGRFDGMQMARLMKL